MLVLVLPSSSNGLGPVDRRRILTFVKSTSHYEYTFDIKAKFDLIYCAGSGDTGLALKLKETGKPLIYDYANHYLQENIPLKNVLRPAYFSFFKGHKYTFETYSSTIQKIIEVADVVVCSSEVQKTYLEQNTKVKNIHVLTDFFENDFPSLFNRKFKPPSTRSQHLIWEGQAENLKNFTSITDREFFKLKISLITDLKYRDGLFKRSSKNFCDRLFNDFVIYDWNVDALISRAQHGDIGIIPIEKDIPIYAAKPENKAVLMFLLGLPVLATSILAYSQLFERLQLDHLKVTDASQWVEKVQQLRGLKNSDYQDLCMYLNNFARKEYSTENLRLKWLNALESY